MSVIEVKDLKKHYGDFKAVSGINIAVDEGELVALLGPSGCGKTTTLRCIAGLERPNGGEIYIGGEPVYSHDDDIYMSSSQRDIGMVFQSFALWPNKSVEGNIMFGLQQRPDIEMSKKEMKSRVTELLDTLDLSGYEDKYPRNLSGGEQQRVALARAMAYNPKVLLLDEPLSNLDAKLRSEARRWLSDLQDETNVTTLYVTHDQAEASALSDEIVILNQGEVEQEGTPYEVFESPQNRFVAEFLGKINILEGKIRSTNGDGVTFRSSDKIKLNLRSIQSMVERDEATIAIAPEDFEIADGDHSNGRTDSIHGIVDKKLYLGDKTELVVDVGGYDLIIRVMGYADQEEGDEISLRVPPGKCTILSD